MLEGLGLLVTGGSRGLGRALCRAGAEAGARVAFTYTRDEDGMRATIEETQAAGGEATAYKVSVLDSEATAVDRGCGCLRPLRHRRGRGGELVGGT